MNAFYTIFLNGALILMSMTNICLADSALEIQERADILREQGKTLEALNLYNHAFVSYQKEHNYKGILSVLSGRLISWQHLFNHEEDKVYAILARNEAEAMLSIAQEYDIHDRDYLIHFLFGKSCIFLKDFKSAESEFEKSVKLYPSDNAEKGDWMAHLGEAIYRNGDKEKGKMVLLQGIEHIKDHADDVDSFRINVWLSGAYFRLAKILMDDDVQEAKLFLQKGEEIVLNDSRLVIRLQQLENLKRKIALNSQRLF